MLALGVESFVGWMHAVNGQALLNERIPRIQMPFVAFLGGAKVT